MRRPAPERRAIGRRAGFCLVLGLCAVLPHPIAAARLPEPEPGQAPQTVLAILDFNRNLCDELAGKVGDRWRRWGDSDSALERVRDYLIRHELSELASARAAGDITRTLLSRVRSEAGSETSASLERFTELVRDLCDTVAWPTGGREDFEGAVRRLLDRIESEEEELGGLVVVNEAEKRAALEPYLTPIQLAAVEAQSEYLDYLESIKPEDRAPTVPELMQAWHRRYSAATAPTKQALGKVLAARNENDSRAMAGVCRELLAAVIPVLRDEKNFKLPSRLVPASRGIAFEVYEPLKTAYDEIRELAVNCSAGRSREVVNHLNEMQKQLQISARHLAKYSLAP